MKIHITVQALVDELRADVDAQVAATLADTQATARKK